jgi:hypothetical protein
LIQEINDNVGIMIIITLDITRTLIFTINIGINKVTYNHITEMLLCIEILFLNKDTDERDRRITTMTCK